MPKCIFCRSTANRFTTREHILPESLGGGDWAILPGNLVCDECQNHFGSEIEQQALGDYPFSFFRTFLGIPTKKGKPPWFTSWEGVIRASLRPSIIGYDPGPPFEEATLTRKKTQMRLLAHPIKANMICRFLLKMGIEVVAADDPEAVFDQKYDASRHYALTGQKERSWWYLQCEDMAMASHYITRGVSFDEWANNVKLDVIVIEDNAEIFHLRLLYMDILVPLEPRIKPQLEGLEEPEYRLFVV